MAFLTVAADQETFMARKLPPVHPGETREEFLAPLRLTPYAVTAALNAAVLRCQCSQSDKNV
jgi:hypothetical protein